MCAWRRSPSRRPTKSGRTAPQGFSPPPWTAMPPAGCRITGARCARWPPAPDCRPRRSPLRCWRRCSVTTGRCPPGRRSRRRAPIDGHRRPVGELFRIAGRPQVEPRGRVEPRPRVGRRQRVGACARKIDPAQRGVDNRIAEPETIGAGRGRNSSIGRGPAPGEASAHGPPEAATAPTTPGGAIGRPPGIAAGPTTGRRSAEPAPTAQPAPTAGVPPGPVRQGHSTEAGRARRAHSVIPEPVRNARRQRGPVRAAVGRASTIMKAKSISSIRPLRHPEIT